MAERPPEQERELRAARDKFDRVVPPEAGLPEQEEAKRIAETWVDEQEPDIFETADIFRLSRAHLALLAAYEDRSKAFERAAADCVRLEGENKRLREPVTTMAELSARLNALIESAWANIEEFGEASWNENARFAYKHLRRAVEDIEAACPEDEQHARAEHLREAREVEQHQEEKHGG